MPGKNLLFKKRQTLFKQGDTSDGMYIIRRGEIEVYLEQGSDEITLANIKAGGMLGEMALFDKQPRSASARALEDSEVTLVSPEDFNRILNQIPKWFVSIMAALSKRLRQTNQKLQAFENKSDIFSLLNITKLLDLLDFLFQKHGEKEGKYWHLNCEIAASKIMKILEIDQASFDKSIDYFLQTGILQKSKNRYNHPTLVLPSRGEIPKLARFIDRLIANDSSLKSIPDELISMIHVLHEIAKESAYDQVNLFWEDFIKEGKQMSIDTGDWSKFRKLLVNLDEAVAIGKNGTRIAIRIEKNLISRLDTICSKIKKIGKPEAKLAS